MESILGSTSKVMIAMKEGNNIMYLPLDRIAQGAGDSAAPAGEDAIRGIADSVVRQLDARRSGDSARTNR